MRYPDWTALDALPLPTRIARAFQSEGWKTLGDVRNLSDRDFLRIPNLSRKSLNIWRELRSSLEDGADENAERIRAEAMIHEGVRILAELAKIGQGNDADAGK